MDIRDTYSARGQWLKAEDIAGKEVELRIDSVALEGIPDRDTHAVQQKAVMYFSGTDRSLVLNVTNSQRLEEAYGPETDNWTGKPVVLYTEKTRNPSGQPVQGIRVRVPQPKADDSGIPF